MATTFAIPALAGNVLTFTVSPSLLELKGRAGSSARGVVTVENGSAYQLRFHAEVRPVEEARESDSAVASVAPEFFTLPPRGRAEILVTAAVPDDRAERFAALLVSVPPVGVGRGVLIAPGVMVRVFVRNGSGRIAGAIRRIDGRWRGEVAEIRVVFENTGDLHLRPIGRLVVEAGGREVARSEVAVPTVYPGTARTFTASTRPLPHGEYAVKVIVDHGGAMLSVGEVRLAR
jgi:P pilus assembly chaperone PapD